MNRCFACGRKLGRNPARVDCADDQKGVLVGSGGPRLFPLRSCSCSKPLGTSSTCQRCGRSKKGNAMKAKAPHKAMCFCKRCVMLRGVVTLYATREPR